MKEPSTGPSTFLSWITGARKEEHGRVLLCFAALHALLISYYLIKPLRNSQFLKEFDSDFLPVVTFAVVALSFIVTKIFGYLADRVEKYRLVTWSYLVIMVVKIAFTWLLMYAGKAAVLAFYFFASVYFLLAIATMWACANDIFTPEQGERCFGFIAVGSTLGSIVGSWISGLIVKSQYKNYAPIASALCMGLALGLILLAARQRREQRAEIRAGEGVAEVDEPKTEFWADVMQILRRPYVRRIGIMVMVLAIFSSSLDYISSDHIDAEVARQKYDSVFSYLGEDSYDTVVGLKHESSERREHTLSELATASHLPVQQLMDDYQAYQQGRESEMREFFSDVSYWQGLLGIFLLLVVARFLFTNFGLRQAAVFLPLVAAVGTVAFAFPLGLGAIQLVIVVAGAANYSLNNAAKEVLYTASDEETKFKYKPLIEGPGMRLGDVLAATLAILLKHLAARAGWADRTEQHVLLAAVFVMVLVWLRAAYLAGLEYDTERRERPSPLASPTAPPVLDHNRE